jgi:hypothetical protein
VTALALAAKDVGVDLEVPEPTARSPFLSHHVDFDPPACLGKRGTSSLLQIPGGLAQVTRQVTRPFMKQTLLFLCLALILFQSGCAMPPPIEQQTLDEQKEAQAAKKSDAFARGLSQ